MPDKFKLKVDLKDLTTIYTILKDNNGEEVVEKHIFDETCSMNERDRILFAILIAFGYGSDWIRDSGILASWDESKITEEDDMMFFVDKKTAEIRAADMLEDVRKAIEFEKAKEQT